MPLKKFNPILLLFLAVVGIAVVVIVARHSRNTATKASFDGYLRDATGQEAVFFGSTTQHPLGLSFLGFTNDSSKIRVPWFCVSNHSTVNLNYLAEKNGQPRYALIGVVPLSDTAGYRAITNYNLRLDASLNVSLKPGGAIAFPVRVPTGVTGAVVMVNYLPAKIRWGEQVRDFFTRLSGNPIIRQYENLATPLPESW